MNVKELLKSLNQQGVHLWADKDKLRINSPQGILTPQLQADIAARKTEILTFLRKNNVNCDNFTHEASNLSLQTIGRLIGGFSEELSMQFKSPVIDANVMAKKLKVTFRPLPKKFQNQTVLEFREELKQKFQKYGVKIIPWQEGTEDFCYQIPLALLGKKILNLKIKTRLVKSEINAVIDVERPLNLIGKLKSLIAENIYNLYSRLISPSSRLSVAKIAQLISWGEDHAIQYLEDPTSTQVILISELDKNFVDWQLPYQNKIAIGVNTLVRNFSEVVIGVSRDNISILNMNLSDSLFPRDQIEGFILKSLIPKIYVPISPLPMKQFHIGKYQPQQSIYAKKLVQLSQALASTGLFPSGFKLSKIIKRKSHRDIVDSIVNGRTGVSYGFVAYAEPPQYIGAVEISQREWESLSPLEGYSSDEVRQNEIGRRYIKTKIKNQYVYKQIPDIWLVCSRSGANKTDLNLESDILRIGLKNRLYLQFPEKIDPTKVDIKPSYDTYVMVAIAITSALYTPKLIAKGAPIVHFHGYCCKEWFAANEYYTGADNPSVPCGTYESGVFNFLGMHSIADKHDSNILLASLIEPDHGTNIIASDWEYLVARVKAGVEKGQIELGGKHFPSLAKN